MTYRIELEKIDRRYKAYDYNEHVYGIKEIVTFLAECVPDDCTVVKIVKTTKDGKGYDITSKYIH